MRLFRRDHTPSADELGAGSPLTVDVIDGQPVPALTWTRENRRVLDLAQPALAVLRDAGVSGGAHLRAGPVVGGVVGEVRLRGGGVLGLDVDASGHGFSLARRAGTQVHATGLIDVEVTRRPGGALGDVVWAVSDLVSRVDAPAAGLPDPLTVSQGNLQLLAATDDLPERWCACVFVTRAHVVPVDADDDAHRALWVEHTVGVKLHLDGTVAVDPDDADPTGEYSLTSLATAAAWAQADVDLVPYARGLAGRTQEWLGMSIPGL